MTAKGLAIGLALFSLLLFVACGESDEDEARATPTSAVTSTGEAVTAEEEEYLKNVRATWKLFEDKNEAFSEPFALLWPLRERLFTTLKDAGAGTAFVETYEALLTLQPPERFQTDHELMVQTAQELVRLDAEIGLAIEDEDLVAFALLNTEMGKVSGRSSFDLSSAVCNAARRPDSPFPSTCAPSEPVPGAEYGAELYDIIRRFSPQFDTFTGATGLPALVPDEQLDIASIVQPKINTLIEETVQVVGDLEPPKEFRADHERLLTFLEKLLGMSQAAGRAAEERSQEGLGEALAPYEDEWCSARRAFSPAFKPIVSVYFQGPDGPPPCSPPEGPPGSCDGEPY